MKRTQLILFLLAITLFHVNGQDVDIRYNNDKKHDNLSTSLESGRWEFIMSDRAAKGSFKIDKYLGNVFVLAEKKDKTLTWDAIKKEYSVYDRQTPNQINYQLYLGGLAMRFIYLININTGQTWQLVVDEDDSWLFEKIY